MHRLAAAIRRINHLLVVTDAAEADLLSASDIAEQLAERLEGLPGRRASWGFSESSISGNVKAFFDQSPLLGLANAVAPPLFLRVDGDAVRGSVRFGDAYEGPPGKVHGGFVAAAFDEALGMVQSMTGNPGMTGTLTVRYRQPTPLHVELAFLARVERVDGRKIHTTATLHAGELLCAEAEGIFISVSPERFKGSSSDA
jgi:acyl-coenzyme A thioesterase PaaI-like protein